MLKNIDDKRYLQIAKLFLKARARITETRGAVNAIVDELESVLEVVDKDETTMPGGCTVTEWISDEVWNSETTDELLENLYLEKTTEKSE